MPVEWEDEELYRRFRRIPNRIDVAMTAIIERNSAYGEQWMKTNAQWTDRTGNARQGLHGQAERERLNYYMVVLAHAVSYGIWLEVRHNGRYEIINPALRHVGDKVMRDSSRLFARIFAS